jgi:integrase
VGQGAESSVSVQRLPSGRHRAQAWDATEKRNVSVSKILGGRGTYSTRKQALQAVAAAGEKLKSAKESKTTVAEFYALWTSDPLFATRKASTEIHNHERVRGFVKQYGHLPIDEIGDPHVAEWLAGGKKNSTVPALRLMFNEASSPKAGRLIQHNPFARLGIKKGPGRRHIQPPDEPQLWAIISSARKLSGPGFAGWLQVGSFSGLRPGELDALRWERIDFERNRIHVREQFNAKTRTFTLPKNNEVREAPLTEQARAALLALPRDTEFCFVPLRGDHFTGSSRAYHWKAVRAASDWKETLYLTTRHFAGWYMVNELEMTPEDVAVALGHTDGGSLVRTLYGHLDKERALDRVVEAYAAAVRKAEHA